MSDWTIGIIGGSGLYAIDALEDAQWIPIQSPWGQPSDEVLCGTIGHVRVRFLPRHGRGHRIAPSTINARANIDALKRAGCTDILAISAVGSLSEDLAPGRFVTVDQFIDNTKGRPSTFFGDGFVTHVSMADPVCPRLAKHAAKAVTGAGGECTEGATYLAMEGPQFSTRAESRLYRHWGAEVIGMTGMPEARLAREAELPYALLAMVTDYDCWREEGEAVDLAQVVEQMEQNSKLARKAVETFCKGLPRKRSPSPIDHALDNAVITATQQHDRATLAKLDAIAGRLLQQG
ncbi:MAG: S-methyl-5'-thioadenosine phosphorylase [Erythrobacter sp.]|jgi:5'-methylthioadenosine phosphorylase|uniref:S-methyl-5'-thioadenosine phosphorylase n=1 Tax=Qipengyuania citrea TaxID=225971 RepID=UPI001A3D39D7|nr:S-methyl-5'-thioadenosine phosphorylase [Qipengyuania citrea]MBL4717368.1 S-methyl-5'-thioadenosine phosphorylase [Erythrobacter sp.]MCP2017626.1 5'-methylthioadenosine phosphorylase [Qipengyuania citrea]MDE0902684.1 S-methyl-5'-thioadenosine phosphorylase [Erythrobacter sp.]